MITDYVGERSGQDPVCPLCRRAVEIQHTPFRDPSTGRIVHDYCYRIGRTIHAQDSCGTAPPPFAGSADLQAPAVIEAKRVTLEFASRNPRRADAGKNPMDESPLFGGTRQKDLFS